jgi:hypothetical protein
VNIINLDYKSYAHFEKQLGEDAEYIDIRMDRSKPTAFHRVLIIESNNKVFYILAGK